MYIRRQNSYPSLGGWQICPGEVGIFDGERAARAERTPTSSGEGHERIDEMLEKEATVRLSDCPAPWRVLESQRHSRDERGHG